jgi:hypothetical protein
MPIKKPLPKVAPKPTVSAAPPAKKVAKKAAVKSPTPVVAPTPINKTKPLYTDHHRKLSHERSEKLGSPLDPGSLEGALRAADSVSGRTWEVEASYSKPPAKYTWIFFEDGTLSHSGSPGVWRQKGAAIVTEINGRYSQHQGVIDGDTASGSAVNIVGLKWTWTARRIE